MKTFQKVYDKICKVDRRHTDLPNNRMSFPIFIRETATVLRAPLVSTKASCAACQKREYMSSLNYSMLCTTT